MQELREKGVTMEEDMKKMREKIIHLESQANKKCAVEELSSKLDQRQFRIMELASELAQKQEEA